MATKREINVKGFDESTCDLLAEIFAKVILKQMKQEESSSGSNREDWNS